MAEAILLVLLHTLAPLVNFDSIVPNAIGKIIGRTKPATPPKLTLKAAKIIRKTP